jgi:hypothetical protein
MKKLKLRFMKVREEEAKSETTRGGGEGLGKET